MSVLPLTSRWKDLLALENRRAPELFEADDSIIDTLYADEIRKAFSELSVTAVFCVQGVPTVVIVNQKHYDSNEIVRVHAALWNQGLASMLVVITDDMVRVFSLAKASGSDKQFEDRCLIEALNAGAATLSLSGYISGAESGRLWREKADYFNPKERIDYVLLNNLTVAHNLLVEGDLLPSEAQAILIQTMFIAYLEDRQIIGPDYFLSATGQKMDSLAGLLNSGDVDNLEYLFHQLQQDFNGDLFVAPCSFDICDHPKRLNKTCMDILQRFRDGREEMASMNGQLRFWGYNFRFIPVELISAVYDRFLGEDDIARKDAGAYYTPMFLVDTVVSSVWEKLSDKKRTDAVFLDPACGSGIFLVRCFQRMCEHWRANSKQSTIRWDSLLRMLGRVHGRDLNGGAVRVAVFSLYIALLEEVTPPDIRKMIDKGRLLPTLWNKTIVQRNFFDENSDDLKVDVIVGNPPWTSRRNSKSAGIEWSRSRGLPVPTGEEAWAFTWKAREHMRSGGIAAFLLPAMGFLHNHALSGVKARERLFKETKVLRVVNFADLRRQLFDGATSPTALVLFEDRSSYDQPYNFEYWAPKADLNLTIKRFISLSTADKTMLCSDDVEQNSLLFKQRLWMRAPEAKLFRYLSSFPKLGDFIGQYGVLKKRKKNTDEGWVIGQGFKAYRAENNSASSKEYYENTLIGEVPFLPIKKFSSIVVKSNELESWGQKKVHRVGFERAFSGPRIIISRGIRTSNMRLKAAYADETFTFHSILQAIVAPSGQTHRLKLIAAILNSKLAVWFAFHGTASFGAFLPEVQQGELLRIPMPFPKNLFDPDQAKRAENKLVALIDEFKTETARIMYSASVEEEFFKRIDQHTYKFFGLSDDEITLVEDTVDYILPAAQPNSGTFPAIWRPSNAIQRACYAKTLTCSLEDWFDSNVGISVTLTARNQDFAILRLKLTGKTNVVDYMEHSENMFHESLKSLADAIQEPIDQNFQTIPDMRVFLGDSLYLIKPLQLRFWLSSSALADADSIAADLQTLIETSRKRECAL